MLIQIRSFRRDTDALALLRLLQEAEATDQTGETFTGAKLQLYLSAPEHDPDTDRWAIEHPDDKAEHIGHAALYLPGKADDRQVADGMVVIHPAWRRQGLGSELALHLQKRLQESPNTRTFRVYLDPRQEGSKAFGARWELSPNPADSYRRLSADITAMTLKSYLPAGFTLRPYSEVNNLATLVEAMNRSYAGLYGHRTTSEAAFAPLLEAFDLDGFFILFDHKNHVAGTVSAEVAPDLSEENGVPTGRLGSPSVVPEHRSKELYQALLVSGIAYLKAHGMVIADLETWGEPESIIDIYKTHGFTLRSEALAYTKEL